jgi:chromate transporter
VTGGAPGTRPAFADAARFWTRLGFISFGGPAAQIAVMHREIVERRAWLGERQFASALSFCMLLPGPEALQLAIYLGWKLHGIRGGLVAGLGFIVPAVVLLLGLSLAYAHFGDLPVAAGILVGLKSAVLALVLQAIVRIGARALRSPLQVALAIASFVALQWMRIPFPLIVLVAGLCGLAAAWRADAPAVQAPMQGAPGATPARVVIAGLALWALPLVAVSLALGQGSLWTRLYLFFTQAALVTFGGAYAVLGYVTQHFVQQLGWVSAQQAIDGLALAETTPGPLVIVLQFMGFMAGWNQPAPLTAAAGALLAALLASWATFLPSFVLIFLGAPYVERLTANPRIAGALAAITAAVIGVIATLAVMLGSVVLFPGGFGASIAWSSLTIAVATWWLLRTGLALPWILVAAAVAGLAVHAAGWA